MIKLVVKRKNNNADVSYEIKDSTAIEHFCGIAILYKKLKDYTNCTDKEIAEQIKKILDRM